MNSISLINPFDCKKPVDILQRFLQDCKTYQLDKLCNDE